MDEILIKINWIYFLGIIGALIVVAYYSGSRFSKIETDVGWIKDILKGLKIDIGNRDVGAFQKNSPVELSDKGVKFLNDSGMKKYIDERKNDFITQCKIKEDVNTAYDVQGYIFSLLDDWKFDESFEKQLKEYSYQQGISLEIMRRIGGIYLRNLCLEEMNLNKKDIDNKI